VSFLSIPSPGLPRLRIVSRLKARSLDLHTDFLPPRYSKYRTRILQTNTHITCSSDMARTRRRPSGPVPVGSDASHDFTVAIAQLAPTTVNAVTASTRFDLTGVMHNACTATSAQYPGTDQMSVHQRETCADYLSFWTGHTAIASIGTPQALLSLLSMDRTICGAGPSHGIDARRV
jgi:hypothetical protein